MEGTVIAKINPAVSAIAGNSRQVVSPTSKLTPWPDGNICRVPGLQDRGLAGGWLSSRTLPSTGAP